MATTAVAVLRSTHPEPALAVTVVTVLLGVAAGLEPWRLGVLGLAMALNQASVGLSNDWLDAERDRVAGRTDKPVARGDARVGTVRTIALATAALAVPAALPLGPAAATAQAVSLAGGWSYNLGLKSTPFSVLPYVAGFGALPFLVAFAAPAPHWPAWWTVAAASLLGASAHFANVLPDLDDDARTGVRGLPHRLGRVGSVAACWTGLLLAAAALAVGLGTRSDGAAVLGLGAVCATAVLAAAGVALAVRGGSRWPFRLIIVAALVDVVVLVAAGAARA